MLADLHARRCALLATSGHANACIVYMQVGVKAKPFDPTDHTIVPVDGRATFDSELTGLEMLFDASTRSSLRVRHNEDDFLEVSATCFPPAIHRCDLSVDLLANY